MADSDELRAKAAHYRELARMLDENLASLCHELADKYEREAAELPKSVPPKAE